MKQIEVETMLLTLSKLEGHGFYLSCKSNATRYYFRATVGLCRHSPQYFGTAREACQAAREMNYDVDVPRASETERGEEMIESILLALMLQQTPTPGTVNVNISATAGGIVCNFERVAASGVKIDCTEGTNKVSMTAELPTSPSGVVGSVTLTGGNTITWVVKQVTAGTLDWEVAANGTRRAGTF